MKLGWDRLTKRSGRERQSASCLAEQHAVGWGRPWRLATRAVVIYNERLLLAPIETLDAASLGTYAWAFGQGVLVDLTPCVYPLIPITVAVFGAKGVTRGRALFLASRPRTRP